jgi:hypothetical protein
LWGLNHKASGWCWIEWYNITPVNFSLKWFLWMSGRCTMSGYLMMQQESLHTLLTCSRRMNAKQVLKQVSGPEQWHLFITSSSMRYSHSLHENVPSSHTCLDSEEQEQSLFMIIWIWKQAFVHGIFSTPTSYEELWMEKKVTLQGYHPALCEESFDSTWQSMVAMEPHQPACNQVVQKHLWEDKRFPH